MLQQLLQARQQQQVRQPRRLVHMHKPATRVPQVHMQRLPNQRRRLQSQLKRLPQAPPRLPVLLMMLLQVRIVLLQALPKRQIVLMRQLLAKQQLPQRPQLLNRRQIKLAKPQQLQVQLLLLRPNKPTRRIVTRMQLLKRPSQLLALLQVPPQRQR